METKVQLAEKNIPKLDNAIYPYWVFQNVISEEICKQIIDLGNNKWKQATIGDKNALDVGKIDTKT